MSTFIKFLISVCSVEIRKLINIPYKDNKTEFGRITFVPVQNVEPGG